MSDVTGRMRTDALGVTCILMFVFASVVGLSAILIKPIKDPL